MVLASLAFFLGTLCAFAGPHGASLQSIAALAACGALAGIGRQCLARRHRRALALICGAAAAVCVGCVYELSCIHAAVAARWPSQRDAERVLVRARIDGLPTRSAAGLSFDARIAPEHSAERWARHARILWHDAPAVHPRAGQTWQLLVSLRSPRARVNPAALDGERQLFRDGIDAVGTVVTTSRLNKQTGRHGDRVDVLRERIAMHIRAHVADRDAGALLAALAVGATGEMSAAQWRIFSATGTTHLVAISGSHVTMFALAAMAAARWLWRIAVCGRMAIPRETFAASVGLLAAAAYACLAGLSVPTQRTLLMLAAWQLGAACARCSGALPPLCAALCVILAIDPFAALSSGFWLSFVAIVAIGIASNAAAGGRTRIAAAVHVQAALFVALAPLTLGWFGTLSLAGLLVNVAAIPAIGWILVPLVLMALPLAAISPALGDPCLTLAGKLCELAWPWMQAAGESAHAQLYAHPPIWWIPLACIALAALLCPWPMLFRSTLLASVTTLAFATPRIPHGAAQVTVLDVGAATAVVIRTATHTMLYGVGDAFGSDGSSADRDIVSLLRTSGIKAVDAVILGRSSVHGSPGLTAVLAALPVRRVGLPRGPPLDFAGAERCSEARSWQWDEVAFDTLDAASGCVLRITAAGRTLLLAAEGEPATAVDAPNIAIVRSVTPLRAAIDATIVSSRHEVALAKSVSTASSGALQLTLGGGSASTHLTEWRRVRSGAWRITPDTAPFGL